jgi:hypothetical protein
MMNATNNDKMREYLFTPYTSEAQRDSVTLTLRKAGFTASRETCTLRTNASLAAIGLAYGTTSVVDVPPPRSFLHDHLDAFVRNGGSRE